MREQVNFSDRFWNIVGILLQTPCREKSKEAHDSADRATVAAENTKLVCEKVINGCDSHSTH